MKTVRQELIKYKTGLIIGRFQPFHNGHLYLIKKALTLVDGLTIGVGSTNVINPDNPWSYSLRKKMLELVFEKENWRDRLIKIVDIPDTPDDNEWLKLTLERTGQFDVSIGNNEWVNGIFEGAGIPVARITFYKRYILEGEKIRQLMRNGKKWQDRVPPYLLNLIENRS
ncbi:adenylyltransferase/cytidyltransferase family protein [Candidatus Microgenomates bacterium]|nr:adenylyltransferase/cytidyltransferase family protein [Candidatus Microgenomates bacterium]